jgi:hypothetical protein
MESKQFVENALSGRTSLLLFFFFFFFLFGGEEYPHDRVSLTIIKGPDWKHHSKNVVHAIFYFYASKAPQTAPCSSKQLEIIGVRSFETTH